MWKQPIDRRLLALLLLTTACAGGAPPRAPLAADFELRVGDTVELPGATTGTLTFVAVVADSRCPIDVTCVWAGDAEVELSSAVGGGDSRRVVLHTGQEPTEAAIGDLSVRLVDLRPRPRESVAIEAGDYVVVLRLTG